MMAERINSSRCRGRFTEEESATVVGQWTAKVEPQQLVACCHVAPLRNYRRTRLVKRRHIQELTSAIEGILPIFAGKSAALHFLITGATTQPSSAVGRSDDESEPSTAACSSPAFNNIDSCKKIIDSSLSKAYSDGAAEKVDDDKSRKSKRSAHNDKHHRQICSRRASIHNNCLLCCMDPRIDR